VRAINDADSSAADFAFDDEPPRERLQERRRHGRLPVATKKISMLPARVLSGRMRRSEW
jgi:hypothetical protein